MVTERIQYINFLMEDLNEANTRIYEHLMDDEFLELDEEIDAIIDRLTELKESIQDE